MRNFLGGIKKAELKIIDAGKSGKPDELLACAFDIANSLEAKGFETKIRLLESEVLDSFRDRILKHVTVHFNKYE